MTAPDHANAHASEHALRDRIADALSTETWGSDAPIALHPRHRHHSACGICAGDVEAIAEVCAAVVGPELDRLRADLAIMRRIADQQIGDQP